MVSTPDRIKFLKKHHLFHGLSDAELTQIAEALEEREYGQNKVILKQASHDTGFYLIFRGKVRIFRVLNKGTEQLAVLVPHDYFGEIPLGRQRPRTTTAETVEESLLFWFSPKTLQSLMKDIRKFRSNLRIFFGSQKLARRLRVKWLEQDEIIYFITHKHWVILARSLIFPAVVFGVSLFGMLASLGGEGTLFIALLAILILIADIVWAIWLVVDWVNDYYVITNQRVVWLEKILLVRDSRQEAPINAILSVDVKTDYAGRELDYGDVVIRTFVGQLAMLQVNHPYQAGQILEELLARYKEVEERTEIETTKHLLRERLGLPAVGPPVTADQPTDIITAPPRRPRPWEYLFGRVEWFKSRLEKHGSITYRKHWLVLFRQTWKAGLLLLVDLLFVMYRVYKILTAQPGTTRDIEIYSTILFALLLFPLIIWWLIEYIEWGNDIFRITSTHVIDIDRTIWGSEQRRSAPLGSIQSTEARRIGVFGQIFNYGTVYISVGNMQLTFDEVDDPVRVQQDIDRYRIARMNDENKAQAEAEREKIVDWLVTYHRNAEEFREQEQKKSRMNPE